MSFGGSDSSTGSTGSATNSGTALAQTATQGVQQTQAANASQLQGALNSAQGIFNGGGYTAGGQTVNQGVGAVNKGAAAAQGLDAAGTGQLQSTINGDYTSAGNPYFQNLVTQLGQSVKPSIDGQFEADGRYGSGADANAYASALTNQAGQMAYTNYGTERANQLSAAQGLPSYTSGLTQPGQAMIGAGQAQTSSDYAPLNQYLSALQSVSPGQTQMSNSNSTINSANNSISNSVSQSNNDSNHVASK